VELNSYLEQLEEQIRNRKAKAEVIEEIRNHIEDQAEFYEKEGMSAEEAIEQAVRHSPLAPQQIPKGIIFVDIFYRPIGICNPTGT